MEKKKRVFKSTLMGYGVSHINPFYNSQLLSLRFKLYYVQYYAILSPSCSQASVTKALLLSFSHVIYSPLHVFLNILFLCVGVGKTLNYEFLHYAVFSILILFSLTWIYISLSNLPTSTSSVCSFLSVKDQNLRPYTKADNTKFLSC